MQKFSLIVTNLGSYDDDEYIYMMYTSRFETIVIWTNQIQDA